MKTRSAKAKGRRASAEAKAEILTHFPLEDADIAVTPSGCTGEDLWLSPLARRHLPMTFEVKNQESIQIWKALEQAKSHAKGTSLTPALIFKRNREELHIAMRLSDFLKLIRKENHHGQEDHQEKASQEVLQVTAHSGGMHV